MAHKVVDARGFACPEPVVMASKGLDQFEGDVLSILVDSNVAKENVTRFVKRKGFQVEIKEVKPDYEIIIKT